MMMAKARVIGPAGWAALIWAGLAVAVMALGAVLAYATDIAEMIQF